MIIMGHKKTNDEIGKLVYAHGLGYSVDNLNPNEVADEDLEKLWASADEALNAIQLYLEQKLGEDYFNVQS